MRISILFLLLITNLLQAQNLVPNPSFEDTIQFSNGQPGLTTWLTNIGTPDYFSAHYLSPLERLQTPVNSRGNQTAYNGVAYFGFAGINRTRLNQREYMQIELIDSLRKGLVYEVEFYLSLADSFHLAMADSNIGVVFKKELDVSAIDHEVREFRPFYTSDTIWDATDKMGWQKFHYTHKAEGGEKVLVVGCFLKDGDVTTIDLASGGSTIFFRSTAYYYIDQISVQWKDTVSSIAENLLQQELSLYPNPVKNDFFVNYSGKELLSFRLYSLLGEEIPFNLTPTTKGFHLSVNNVSNGIYFLSASTAKGESYTFKVLKR